MIRMHRVIATGPAAAGPMFGRMDKFSTTVFDLSVKQSKHLRMVLNV